MSYSGTFSMCPMWLYDRQINSKKKKNNCCTAVNAAYTVITEGL